MKIGILFLVSLFCTKIDNKSHESVLGALALSNSIQAQKPVPCHL